MDDVNPAWVPVAGIWVRHDRPDRDPIQPRSYGARWQTHATRAAYLADNEDTAWAEWYRGLAEGSQSPQAGLPRNLHRIAVDLDRVADLTSEKARQALGLPPMRPSQSQWPAYRAFGEQLSAEGAQGVLYSSAARTRSRCLCVFAAGLSGLSVEGQPLRVLAPPPPPRGLRT
jgi:RES domain-containing protein